MWSGLELLNIWGPTIAPQNFAVRPLGEGRRILTFPGLLSWLVEPYLSVSVTILSTAPATFFSTKGPPEKFFLISVSLLFFLVYTFPPEFLPSSPRMGRFKLLCFSAQLYLVFVPSKAQYLAPKGLVLP